jgi:protocatechuate 3,4-dioxygenase beta subunit
VVAATSSAPLRRAQITLTAADAQAGQVRRVTTTDANGRYEFTDLPAGRFALSAAKAGYVQMQFGQKRAFEAGTPVTVGDGEAIERIDFALPRGGVITVRVTDDFGEPLAGAQVQVQRSQYGPDGQPRLTQAPTGAAMPFNGTDDRGEFRVFGLMPGEYVVSAAYRNPGGLATAGGNDPNEGFSPTYYPGTINASEAQPVTLGVGEETSLQFAMVAARMARVSGTVVDSEGRPAAGASLSLVTPVGSGGFTSSPGGTVAPDGSFTIGGVPPGEHRIDVRPVSRPGDTIRESASVPVVVAGTDITNLRVVTGRGATIGGRVVFEGTSPRTAPGATLAPRVQATQADPSRVGLSFSPTDPLANGTLDPEGNFEIAGVSGRVFFSLQPGLPNWVLKSVTLDGEDITDEPLDVTDRPEVSGLVIRMTDKLTVVSGQVSDGKGQPVRDYVVVLLPSDEKEPLVASRFIRTVRPDTRGRFETRGLRPGRYVATAIEAIEQGRQFAPDFQRQLRRAAREFEVQEGQSVTLDLRLTLDL